VRGGEKRRGIETDTEANIDSIGEIEIRRPLRRPEPWGGRVRGRGGRETDAERE